MSKYLNIVDDEIQILDTYTPSEHIIHYKKNGLDAIYVMDETPVPIDGDYVVLAGNRVLINSIKVTDIMDNVEETVGIVVSDPKSKLHFKTIAHRLPDPTKVKMKPLAAVVCAAILRDGVAIPMDKKKRQRVATIIRNVSNYVSADKDITLGMAEEVLAFYGLELLDILNPKYIIKE